MKRKLLIGQLFAYCALLLIDCPSMYAATSYTRVSTGGTASASNYYTGNTPARAFDWNQSTFWFGGAVVSGTTKWLRYELSSAKVVTAYKIYPKTSGNYTPKAWKFQGSTNGTSWKTLDTRSAVTSWTGGTAKTFKFSNTTAYKYYRIYVTEINPYYYICYLQYQLAISELALYIYTYPTLSLTLDHSCAISGDSVTLDWTATDVTSVSINQGVGSLYSNSSGTVSKSGSVTLKPTSTTTYTVTAKGPGGTKTKKITVTVYPDVLDYDEDGIPDWYELQENDDFDQDEDDGNCYCD